MMTLKGHLSVCSAAVCGGVSGSRGRALIVVGGLDLIGANKNAG